VDFVDNIAGGGFTIRNPNATSTCGCGQSFTVDDEQAEAQDQHAH
jgi:iron-sulfur cluster assembly protein